MEAWLSTLTDWLSHERVMLGVRAGLKVLFGFVLARLAATGIQRIFSERLSAHQAMLAKRLAFYSIFGIFIASALHEVGFKLSVLLGAAGIFAVAIGFASQTSASNIISGLFLLGERPFSVGDVIRIGQTTGEVISIDLLAVKLRTYDNLFVRIPNENLIKSEITNLLRFPIRRVDLQIGVAYKEDISRVREVLMEVARKNPVCLEEPKPLIIFQGFGDSSINHQLSVWAARQNFLQLRNTLPIEIKETFDEKGIEIPFPHRSIYTGSVTDPLPVEIKRSEDSPTKTEPSDSGSDSGAE